MHGPPGAPMLPQFAVGMTGADSSHFSSPSSVLPSLLAPTVSARDNHMDDNLEGKKTTSQLLPFSFQSIYPHHNPAFT